jgi:hypothetical protein
MKGLRGYSRLMESPWLYLSCVRTEGKECLGCLLDKCMKESSLREVDL